LTLINPASMLVPLSEKTAAPRWPELIMAERLRQVRRAATQFAIRHAITATGSLPLAVQHGLVGSSVTFAGGLPILRSRVRQNIRMALGRDVPGQTISAYFRHAGWCFSRSLSTFHRGVMATPVPEEISFDESVRLLDEAVSEGRGVVLTAPHWAGHELAAAVINRRHPMAMLVRQAASPEAMKRKLAWYDALGVEVVLRPAGESMIKEAVAYLKILKAGKLLAITPDLLADPPRGIETRLFGRQARLHGGAFALALLAQAPMIRVFGRWSSDSSAVVMFDRAPAIPGAGDRDAAVRAAAQDWCRWFEEKLRANPENWLFWLDKRWSRFLRATPRTFGSE
jgi:lauroyl/myristoyl acyltransferase